MTDERDEPCTCQGLFDMIQVCDPCARKIKRGEDPDPRHMALLAKAGEGWTKGWQQLEAEEREEWNAV